MEKFLAVVLDTRDPFERAIVKWGISQLVPLTLLRPGQALVLFHEDLVTDPERHLPVLFQYTRTRGLDSALKRVRKPSALSRKSLPPSRVNPAVTGRWQGQVSQEQRQRAAQLLHRLGLDVLYGAEPEPRPRDVAAERFPCLAYYPEGGCSESPS